MTKVEHDWNYIKQNDIWVTTNGCGFTTFYISSTWGPSPSQNESCGIFTGTANKHACLNQRTQKHLTRTRDEASTQRTFYIT